MPAAPFVFNPLDPATRRDPYAIYKQGREHAPVLRHEGLPLRVVSVFRHQDCLAILKDDATWSSDFRAVAGARPEELAGSAPPSMIATDGAVHARLRSLVNKAFTPRIVSQLEPRMRALAKEMVEAAVAEGEVDLVQALTYPLPVTVIAEMIGVPAEDHPRVKAWSDEAISVLGTGFFGGLDEARIRRQRQLLDEMHAYFIPLAEDRKTTPREDLMTGLVQAEHEGSKLSYDEMLSMLVLLLVAGNETTTTLIGNIVLELLEHPEALARVRADRKLVPGVVDEVLRFRSPVQFDPRRATRKLRMYDETIEENDFVVCWLGSANRDEQAFDRPDVFDIDRGRGATLAFGFGVHFCLGANLARLEAQVALDALLEGTRSFKRMTDAELPLHPSPVFLGVTSLPLRLVGT